MILKAYKGAADKRYTAIFKDGKTVHFGQRGGSTYIDHGNKEKRAAYIARHSKNGENWGDPRSAGALSRFLLWGDSTSLRTNIASFKRKFNL